MGGTRTYSDQALTEAVAGARSWRGVLRALGLTATSASAMRSVRRNADLLGLDYSHFTGGRRWTDDELAAAVRDSRSWAAVQTSLGLAGGSSCSTLKGHALRLGLDTGHLNGKPTRPADAVWDMRPEPAHLRTAGSLLAAAWFVHCGHAVCWPLEPCRYDLLVYLDNEPARVQVKTTTMASGDSWEARISTSGDKKMAYDPDEIDYFFVISGDLSYYLIPIAAVGGLHYIRLSAYSQYSLGAAGSLS